METFIYKPIGIIHTPFKDIQDMPIQPVAARGIKGEIELYKGYIAGLKDLDGFSHITLLYHFHKVKRAELQVVPFMDKEKRGIFSCKAPKRPNPIGISTVKLLNIKNNRIFIEEVDMLDGTPLLDIKPFHPLFDNRDGVKTGWLNNGQELTSDNMRSDNRFR